MALIAEFHPEALYATEATRIYILAVAHFRRRPGYWRSRSGA